MSLNNRCDAYKVENGQPCCWGTKDGEPCSCNGDRTLCDFYPEVREKAIAKYQEEDTTKILKDFGVLDSEGKLSEVYRNIYELRKKQLTGAKNGTVWSTCIKPISINNEKLDVVHYACTTCEFSIPKQRVTEDYKYCPKCGREITYSNEILNLN